MKALRYSLLIALPLIFSINPARAQDRVEKCSMVVLQKTENLLQDIPTENVRDFLLTFSESCNGDGSYTPLSNKLLFQLLDQQTEKLLAVMSANEQRIDMGVILYTFSHPLNTSFDIPALIKKTESAQQGGGLRARIANALKKSTEKKPGQLD